MDIYGYLCNVSPFSDIAMCFITCAKWKAHMLTGHDRDAEMLKGKQGVAGISRFLDKAALNLWNTLDFSGFLWNYVCFPHVEQVQLITFANWEKVTATGMITPNLPLIERIIYQSQQRRNNHDIVTIFFPRETTGFPNRCSLMLNDLEGYHCAFTTVHCAGLCG